MRWHFIAWLVHENLLIPNNLKWNERIENDRYKPE